jgi:putative DNA methylase
MSDTAITPDYVKSNGRAGRMGQTLIAIVAEGNRSRVYVAPTETHEALALSAKPAREPETNLPNDPRNFWTVDYGLTTFGDLFTDRQLVALNTFSDLVHEARVQIEVDARAGGLSTTSYRCATAVAEPKPMPRL